jgi:hypothetical protein
MNLFILDKDPILAAQYQCDKHVVKMVTETAQLLSTALIEMGLDAPYKATHRNHPCRLWVSESKENYEWAWRLGHALGREYTHRYGKIHKAWLKFEEGHLDLPNGATFPKTGLTPFRLAMPDEYRQEDAVQAYKDYYLGEKAHLLQYKNRDVPEWIGINL